MDRRSEKEGQMSEFTQHQRLPATAEMSRWASLTMIAAMIAAAVLVTIVVVAAAGLLDRPAINAPGLGVETGQQGSRLDDYGLRHPVTAPGAIEPGSRLDDYGLRHPFGD
jgi:hypothetical protein